MINTMYTSIDHMAGTIIILAGVITGIARIDRSRIKSTDN
jgi:hypothetical protein